MNEWIHFLKKKNKTARFVPLRLGKKSDPDESRSQLLPFTNIFILTVIKEG